MGFRIALNQGLHRDPSLFPTGSMDVITIELRRRVWHQLGHLEFRAAECKGQEPSITEDFYTTLFPRNIDDEDLVDGASPGAAPYDESKFTLMTFQLVRFNGMRALRRIIQSTYRLERRILDSGLNGTSRPDPAQELRNLYEQIKVMLDEFHEENQRKYLQNLNPDIPMQRLTLGLASLLEWRAYLLFWLRMPRAYRDVVFTNDIRRSIFEKSISCVEAMNVAAADIDAAQFQWHIRGIASFQAIMHILSELRNPLFDVPERQRALRALQMSRVIRENNSAKAWQAVKNMIDKAIAEHSSSVRAQQTQPSSYMDQQPLESSTSKSIFAAVRTAGDYAYPRFATSYDQPVQTPSQPPPPPPVHAMQPQPDPMQHVQTMQSQAPCWDDFNLSNINNIVGDFPNADVIPDFDFGFWGDPFNYEIEPTAMQMQDAYLPQWIG
ncbi:C6 transcription factor [Pyrenophora seminiperda CCB06]|uniref:C6 transcription factor n=1 Tax=Pyrenophora seminiperda CCB06 TaxID=1302712 RepID=A0A3M7M8V1_9PLEO|nr:C6 transcription factor [Pyrenophora seminiperda CCB06]